MRLIYDIKTNVHNLKGMLFIISFRIASFIRMRFYLLYPFFFIPLFHTVLFNWFLGYDIPLSTKIGKGLKIYHGQGLVINADTIIGNDCVLRHGTTIGNKLDKLGNDLGSPVIGDSCEFGAQVIAIGRIHIGNHVIIGAGTIVTKDIPANSIAYGNPLVIKSIS